jgi:hypothetical protein
MFDSKGHFAPLNDTQLARLNDEQRRCYDELAAEVAELVAANNEADEAIATDRSALAAPRNAEAAEAKKPKHTFLDELRRTQGQWRADHR